MLPSQAWFRSPVTVFHFSLLSQPSFAIYQHPELRIICSEATIWRGTNYSYIQVKNVVPNYSPSGSPPRWRILFAPALAGLCIIFKFFSSILGSWWAFRLNLKEPVATRLSPKLSLRTAVADMPCSIMSVPQALKKPAVNPPAVSSKHHPWQFVHMLLNSDTSQHYSCCLGKAEGSSVSLAWMHMGKTQCKEGLLQEWP